MPERTFKIGDKIESPWQGHEHRTITKLTTIKDEDGTHKIAILNDGEWEYLSELELWDEEEDG